MGESNKTQLLENYMLKLLPYYQTHYAHLLKKGIGYQGLIYREAVESRSILEVNY
jgi:hypothetical protein